MPTKAETLATDWGYSSPEDCAADYMFEGVNPAICMNKGCDYSTEMEPDQDQGWCESCGTNTLKSISVLLGVI